MEHTKNKSRREQKILRAFQATQNNKCFVQEVGTRRKRRRTNEKVFLIFSFLSDKITSCKVSLRN